MPVIRYHKPSKTGTIRHEDIARRLAAKEQADADAAVAESQRLAAEEAARAAIAPKPDPKPAFPAPSFKEKTS